DLERRVRLLVLLERDGRREREGELRNAEEPGERRVEELLLAGEARVVLHVGDLREAHARDAALREDGDAEAAAEVEDTVLVELDAVAVEELLEAVRVQLRVHRRVVRLHVHGAGDDGEALALHHELVDAAELLLAEVLAGLGDDEPVERLVNLAVAAL